MNRNKYFIAGAALVAGALVVIFAVSGWPPSDDVAGTMAGADTTIAGVEQAERYRADAISETDVELDDQAINDLLQNPEVVAALQNENFRTAITDGSLTEALRSSDWLTVLNDGSLKTALAENPDFLRALSEDQLSEFLKDDSALRDFDPQVRSALRDDNALAALSSMALRDFLTSENFLRGRFDNALTDQNLLRSVGSGVLGSALKDADFLRRLDAVDDM